MENFRLGNLRPDATERVDTVCVPRCPGMVQTDLLMNGWFLAAGGVTVAAFFVHLFGGNRFYTCARPDRRDGPAYEAWLMGRCGVQMITTDLALGATCMLLLGFGVIPRNFYLELFLLATCGGWFLLWLVSLRCEHSRRAYYFRLCHWLLFLVLAVLLFAGMRF